MSRDTNKPGLSTEKIYDSEIMDYFVGDYAKIIEEDFGIGLRRLLRIRNEGGKFKGNLVIDIRFEVREPEDET